ncbi:MAG: VWA domain-containing protein [Deltaproteobacteria bacterium]|nr:VWA domain-containing protein [Deltaproteobacteria bacterium]MBW1847286.1 VWA domain-containing protein [Deltaproteobacteria bacterium]
MNKILIIILSLAFISIASIQNVSADNNIHLILDASGSMWGKVGGREKIVIAKEVIKKLISNIPDNVQVGLTVYGHRSKNDCQDIELLVPTEKGNRKLLTDKITSIVPKGSTPISKSLEVVEKHLRQVKGLTNIVLVSDGKETCGGDPCRLVRRLIVQGVNFKMFVVGFDVTAEEGKQLNCMAETGGGQYFDARNAEQLMAALTTVKEKVIEHNFEAIELSPIDIGSSSNNTFSILPTQNPALFGLKGSKIGKINFDETPDGKKLASGTDLTNHYASSGVMMNSIIISDSVFGGAASAPNATKSPTVKDFGQIFTFTVPVVAVGVINTSPDKDRVEIWSGPNGSGSLLFSFIDQVGKNKNYDVDRFVGVRALGNNRIGSIVFKNNTGNIELDEFIFEIDQQL